MNGNPGPPTGQWRRLVPIALIVAVGTFAFWPAIHGGWMWDDRLDVTQNGLLRSATGLGRIWFDPIGLYDYYPLKYSVQWLQWHLWHLDTFGYHATNIALHLVSALLLTRILRRLGLPFAWIGGLFFAVHPLTVESVAWISELKNTLSLPLLLLSFDRYMSFDESRRRSDYAASVVFFSAAMLSKTAGVMFPGALLLYAWWKRQRMSRADLIAALPFAVVSLVLGLVTWWFQQHVAIGESAVAFDPIGGWGARMACAGTAAAFYLYKALVPVNLMPVYPQWPVNPPMWWALLPWIGFAALAAVAWTRRKTWGRHVVFGLGWFLLFAAPILGFVPISSQRFTWVMDHLVYVPLLGVIGIAAAAVGTIIHPMNPRRRRWSVVAATMAGMALAVISRNHAADFRDEETLWSMNTRQNPQAWMAFFNLGRIYQDSGRTTAALAMYETTLRLYPDYADAYYNLGNLWRGTGRAQDAIGAYRHALRLAPGMYLAHGNLALALADRGQEREAIAECERAIALHPEYVKGHYNLGSLLVRTGRPAEAIPHLAEALRLDPGLPDAENNYAVALSQVGRLNDAVEHFHQALTRNPNAADARNNLGNTLRQLGKNTEAIVQFRRAVELRPDYESAWYNLGCAEAVSGRFVDAINAFERVLRIQPQNVDARVNLAAVLGAAGRKTDARAQYEQARRLRPSLPVVSF